MSREAPSFPSECLRYWGRKAVVVGSSPAAFSFAPVLDGYPLDEMGYRHHDHCKPEELWMEQLMKLPKINVLVRRSDDVVGVLRVLPSFTST